MVEVEEDFVLLLRIVGLGVIASFLIVFIFLFIADRYNDKKAEAVAAVIAIMVCGISAFVLAAAALVLPW